MIHSIDDNNQIYNSRAIAKGSNLRSLMIIAERSKFPIIPPIFDINPFKELAVLLASGTQTSEYIAKIFPLERDVKKKPKNPIVIKKIQDNAISKGVSILKGIK